MSRKAHNLTQHFVDHDAQAPARGMTTYADGALPGFALRVGASGHKSWTITYRLHGRQTRYTFATLALEPSVKAARETARDLLQGIRKGIDPAAPAKAAKVAQTTLAEVAAKYLDHCGRKNRASTVREYTRIFDKDVLPALGERPMAAVTRADIRGILETVAARGGNPMRDHTLVVVKSFLNWAAEPDQEYIEKSPIEGMGRLAPPRERDRWLNNQEIAWFWQGCDEIGEPFADLFRLLLLTGQRLGEVAHMRWEQVEPQERRLWTIPAAKAKNARTHQVPLSGMAAAIVAARPEFRTEHGRAPWLFTVTGETPCSGFSKGKERLDRAMIRARRRSLGLPEDDAAYRVAVNLPDDAHLPVEIEPWRLHDLRRTITSGMAELGVAEHVCDKILNHVGGTISGVKKVYNRYEYLPERQAALDLWARHVATVTAPKPAGNVVALPLPGAERKAGR